jgi:hypothetical protein
MKPNDKNLFLRQEINTTNWLLHAQALLHLPRLDVPESDRLVVAPANQSFPPEQEGSAEIGVPVQETEALGKGLIEVGFAMM